MSTGYFDPSKILTILFDYKFYQDSNGIIHDIIDMDRISKSVLNS